MSVPLQSNRILEYSHPLISYFIPFHYSGDDPNVVKVSVKLPWGKQVVRRYHKTDLVQSVYSFAQSLSIEKDAANKGKGFDLCTAYPSLSLSDLMTNTIGEAGIAGSQVIMRWNA